MEPLVRIKFGSHLYGTATPTSDEDWKSVRVPSAADILLQRTAPVVVHARPTKVGDGLRNKPGDVDDESYALHRYMQLLAEGQTVALDMLFAPAPEFASDVWRRVQTNYSRFVSKKSAAFVGYCRTQANKYGIKGSRVAAARRAASFFAAARGAYGESARLGDLAEVNGEFMSTLLDNAHTSIVQGGTTERPETFFECCNRKCSFGNTVKAAYEMYSRVFQEYGARARMAEAGEGIDWKALSHAVRVGTEALELLTTGRITFPLHTADFLVAVKTGQVPYVEVARGIEELLEAVEQASVESSLPEDPDTALMDEIVMDAYEAEVRRHYGRQS